MVDSVIPPLPPGFTLDQAPAAPAVPPLPPGFTLDAPQGVAPQAGAGSTELVSTTPAQGGHPARVTIGTNPAPPPTALHSLRVGAQGVGAGLRDIALMPFDLMAGAQNLVTGGINKVFGTEIPQATPASQMAEKALEPFSIPESEMSPREKLGYNIDRYGTQGLGMGSMLAARAPALIARSAPAPTFAGRAADTLTRPYADAISAGSPARPLIGDAVAGAGSGAGVNAQQEYAPDSTAAKILAPLAGGVGAAGAQGLVEGIGGLIRNIFRNHKADVNVPLNPKTGAPFTRAETDRAAGEMQKQTTFAQRDGKAGPNSFPPAALAKDIRENAAELTNPTLPGEESISPNAVPTSGMLSRDAGLVTAEQKARTQNSTPFIERDLNVKGVAAERVEKMRNPNADQGATSQFMREEPKRLASERDAEALPLLRQAEQAGAQVDANPVVALIDEKLATAKRPPVRAALTEARKQLNKVGSDELDTSVSGLYEARKAINDIIEGRGENATGKFAKRELLEVRGALDDAIKTASPEFGQYLQKYREGSEPIDAFTENPTVQAVANPKNDDIRNTVKSIMANGVYGGERQAEAIGKLIAQNPEAKDGWRAAVSDVLADKVTGTKQIGESNEVHFQRLAKEFNENEATLAKVYSPEEMNTLRQAHKLLEYSKEADKRATVGSPTAERMIPQALQLAARHFWGDLKGGGIIKRAKLMLELLPSNKQSAEELMNMAWFDPNVAAYLLDKPVANKMTLQYNPRVQRLIAIGHVARGDGSDKRTKK